MYSIKFAADQNQGSDQNLVSWKSQPTFLSVFFEEQNCLNIILMSAVSTLIVTFLRTSDRMFHRHLKLRFFNSLLRKLFEKVSHHGLKYFSPLNGQMHMFTSFAWEITLQKASIEDGAPSWVISITLQMRAMESATDWICDYLILSTRIHVAWRGRIKQKIISTKNVA